jgi:hypothetical protein
MAATDADSVHVTEGGAIGMNVGGYVIAMRPSEWHAACKEAADLRTQLEAIEAERDSLLEGIRALHKVWWTVGADLDKEAVAQQCLKLFKLLPARSDKNG